MDPGIQAPRPNVDPGVRASPQNTDPGVPHRKTQMSPPGTPNHPPTHGCHSSPVPPLTPIRLITGVPPYPTADPGIRASPKSAPGVSQGHPITPPTHGCLPGGSPIPPTGGLQPSPPPSPPGAPLGPHDLSDQHQPLVGAAEGQAGPGAALGPAGLHDGRWRRYRVRGGPPAPQGGAGITGRGQAAATATPLGGGGERGVAWRGGNPLEGAGLRAGKPPVIGRGRSLARGKPRGSRGAGLRVGGG